MPTIGVIRDELFQRLGRTYTDAEFDELCFEFGIELDDVTSERQMKANETGKVDETADDTIMYKIEVPANRYDLLCIEGIARALAIFIGSQTQPSYKTVNPPKLQRLVAQPETKEVRQFVVAGILRGVTFNKSNYDSFIDLQDKLHQNIGRRRTLVSVGTHDLDTIEGPFTYEALVPEEIKFAPLNKKEVYDGHQLMEVLSHDLHLKPYLPIIRDRPRYPVIYDSKRRVLSLPPIINGDHSKITLNTKNVLIEVTATDKTKAQIVLQVMCAMFGEYCADKFSVEQVEVVYPGQGPNGGDLVEIHPDMSSREQTATVEYINRLVGFQPRLDAAEISKLLTRMSLTSKPNAAGDEVIVDVPCTRSDVLHACDIMEDVAIGFGFNKLTKVLPQTVTIGRQQPLNKLTDLLRAQVAGAGYLEVLNFILCSQRDNHDDVLRPVDGLSIKVGNPKGADYETCRRSLLAGILKSLAHNKGLPLPLRLFEIGDCVVKDNTTDTGARNIRKLTAISCSSTAGFEVVHGLLDRVMLLLNIPPGKPVDGKKSYYLQAGEDPAYFPGRRADVWYFDGKAARVVGVIGAVHPVVLKNFDLAFPASAVELEIGTFHNLP